MMKRKGMFEVKLKYDNTTILDTKAMSFDEVQRSFRECEKKIR